MFLSVKSQNIYVLTGTLELQTNDLSKIKQQAKIKNFILFHHNFYFSLLFLLFLLLKSLKFILKKHTLFFFFQGANVTYTYILASTYVLLIDKLWLPRLKSDCTPDPVSASVCLDIASLGKTSGRGATDFRVVI